MTGLLMRPSLFVGRHSWLTVAAVIGLMALSTTVTPRSAQAQATLVVDADGKATPGDCDGSQKAFGSIQGAVDAAPPGSTILICPGTYAEQVIVTASNLTIRGIDQARTVLQPSALPVDPGSPSAGTPRKAIVLVNGATGVTVASLTIDSSTADGGATHHANCASVGFTFGIYYRNSSGTVDSTRTTNVRSAARCSAGVFAESGGAGATNLEIRSSTVDNYGLDGIVCNGLSTACSITGNALRGRGPVDDEVQCGVVIRFGASATISGNAIRNHFFTPRGGVDSIALGILLVYATPDSNPHLLRDNR
jgi:hypothetical protein